MNLPAFKFVDGNLVELRVELFGSGFPTTFRERVPRAIEPKLVRRKLTPRLRRFYARKGRPRRQSKRVGVWTPEWKYPIFSTCDEVVWERHTIAVNDEIQEPFRPWCMVDRTRLVGFVYMPEGIAPTDFVINAVARMDRHRRLP